MTRWAQLEFACVKRFVVLLLIDVSAGYGASWATMRTENGKPFRPKMCLGRRGRRCDRGESSEVQSWCVCANARLAQHRALRAARSFVRSLALHLNSCSLAASSRMGMSGSATGLARTRLRATGSQFGESPGGESSLCPWFLK